ncbi:MAG: glycoside hydrolase family 1 protein, partial [Halieaceae bacterium]|nr:glycoside hydrolase family 1 protein [Halieaceae bacterium]
MKLPAVVLLSSLFLVACDNNSDHDEPGFPDGFLFGTATAAHQVESNNTNNDWYAWETLGRIRDGHSNLNGPDYWNNYSNDFDFAQLLGTNAYRFSLEWSKIEPVKDQYDRAAIDHYHLMIDDMRAKGMQPVVTLQHFTL